MAIVAVEGDDFAQMAKELKLYCSEELLRAPPTVYSWVTPNTLDKHLAPPKRLKTSKHPKEFWFSQGHST